LARPVVMSFRVSGWLYSHGLIKPSGGRLRECSMLFRMVIMAAIMGLEMLVPPLELVSPTTTVGRIQPRAKYQEIPDIRKSPAR
jgi:hypothetical protein